jgi:hypothetical protein
LRSAANWLMRNGGLAATTYHGATNNVEWLEDRKILIATYRDEPKTILRTLSAYRDCGITK